VSPHRAPESCGRTLATPAAESCISNHASEVLADFTELFAIQPLAIASLSLRMILDLCAYPIG
jgi:hypothetical protein